MNAPSGLFGLPIPDFNSHDQQHPTDGPVFHGIDDMHIRTGHLEQSGVVRRQCIEFAILRGVLDDRYNPTKARVLGVVHLSMDGVSARAERHSGPDERVHRLACFRFVRAQERARAIEYLAGRLKRLRVVGAPALAVGLGIGGKDIRHHLRRRTRS